MSNPLVPYTRFLAMRDRRERERFDLVPAPDASAPSGARMGRVLTLRFERVGEECEGLRTVVEAPRGEGPLGPAEEQIAVAVAHVRSTSRCDGPNG